MKVPLGLSAITVMAIVATWWWLGSPVEMPPLDRGGKTHCMSYAPFRDGQNPLEPSTRVEAWQIEEDLARLAPLTGCLRTYSIEHGLDQIAGLAERHGLKVIQGLWLSSNRQKNRVQIDTTIALAKRYPHVISAVVVGNEVLLRGELSATDLGNVIREVKAGVSMPVTYADVWEFWLRNRDLASAVDFITIHILPYWEDFPIPPSQAADHVDAIHDRVAASFPGKDILIGEVGWPSAGRMREGALPSLSNQARVLQEVMARAARENYRVNLIEAFDQPWKRWLEGTVGGHWGLLTADTRAPKFVWGMPVSDHPYWRWQAAGGAIFAGVIFGTALAVRRGSARKISNLVWLGIAVNALAGGIFAVWTIETMAVESLGIGGWLRGLALAAVAITAPFAGTATLVRGARLPAFACTLGRAAERPSDPHLLIAGLLLVALTVIAIQTALGLVFDPRYRDFPFAALTATTVPFLVHVLLGQRSAGARGKAETIAASVLALSAGYIVANESLANWQALWLALDFVGLAVTLGLVRDARNS